LIDSGWRVHVETNGTVELLLSHCWDFSWLTVSPKPPEWKCGIPTEHVNEVKFVMGTKEAYGTDLDNKVYPSMATIKEYLTFMPLDTPIWLQPESNNPDAVQWCLDVIKRLSTGIDNHPLRLGLSVQMHKLIGVS
jgi:organic radical activating enzyme